MTPISIERMLSIIVAVILLGLSAYEAYKHRYRISTAGFILTACTLFIIVPATRRIDQAKALETGNKPVEVMQTNYKNQMNRYDVMIKHHKNLVDEGTKANKQMPRRIASIQARDPQVSTQIKQYMDFLKKHPKKSIEYSNDADKMAKMQTYGSNSPSIIDIEGVLTNKELVRSRMKYNTFEQRFLKLMPYPISTFTSQDVNSMSAYSNLKNEEEINKLGIQEEKADIRKDQVKQKQYQKHIAQEINTKRQQMIYNHRKKYLDESQFVA